VPIELFLASTGKDPFVVENLRLFLKINVIVECIVVELGIVQSIILGLPLITLIEDVEHFNDCLHNLLLEYFIHNYNSNVELEFLDYLSHLVLWNAMCNKVHSKVLVLTLKLRSKSCLTASEELNHSLKNVMERVEVFHLL
jgi:hypothetical protein